MNWVGKFVRANYLNTIYFLSCINKANDMYTGIVVWVHKPEWQHYIGTPFNLGANEILDNFVLIDPPEGIVK